MAEKNKKSTKKKKSETALWRSTVRITDSGIYERLKFLEEQKNISIPRAITDSLFYGLEPYIKDVYGEIELEEMEDGMVEAVGKPNTVSSCVSDERIDKIQEQLYEIINLLNEVLLNTTICKLVTSSIFNERVKILYCYFVRPELMEKGGLQDTPDFLIGHEKMVIEKIKKEWGRRK